MISTPLEISAHACGTLDSDTLVVKFGSSVLASEDDLQAVAEELRRLVLQGRRVIAVVSAIGTTTRDLLAQANRMAAIPAPHHACMLLATGEMTSAALLAMRCETAGLSSAVATPAQIGLHTYGPCIQATPVDLDTGALEEAMQQHAVVIVPGFIGCDESGSTTLLGRGGSDLTAVFIAQRLGGTCRLIKDVDGLYDRDPQLHPDAQRFERITWDQAIEIGGGVVQQQALEHARDTGLPISVSTIGSDYGTMIAGSRLVRSIAADGRASFDDAACQCTC